MIVISPSSVKIQQCSTQVDFCRLSKKQAKAKQPIQQQLSGILMERCMRALFARSEEVLLKTLPASGMES